ncbi:YfcC family protein [[Acholeplasma] multilocale]|uniref:YfcC family protein n=1 Tax=[Acholeplasma] multilocale TaxID=264638 RepID=UPI00244E1026|nr:YfcC family protein [[Acholeplasma] multilocale]
MATATKAVSEDKTVINNELSKKSFKKLKAKDPNKKKKQFKMMSAFAILLLIIAVLVFLSWILNWTGVTTDVGYSVNMSEWADSTNANVQAIVENWKTSGSPLANTAEFEQWLGSLRTSGLLIDGTSINMNGLISFLQNETIKPAGFVDIFFAPIQGFLGKTGVIIFILVLGAFIQIVVSSKALEGLSQGIVSKLKGKEIWAIIPLMIFFSVCGTAEGMAEESLGFYMICIPLMIAAGFDTFTGLLIVLVGAGTGTLASTVNPFVINVALDGLNGSGAVSETISVGDGLVWRFVTWAVMTGAAIAYVMMYARKVKMNPSKSITFSTAEGDKKFFLSANVEKIEMNGKRKAILGLFAVTFILMIVYLVDWDSIFGVTAMADAGNWVNDKAPWITSMIPGWGQGGLDVIAAMFLISALVMAIVLGLGEDGFLKEFMTGTSDILSVCLVIATAGGVGVILEQTHMQELFVNALGSSVGGISSQVGKILVLFILFLPLSFLIPSTSGFAAAIFPLLVGTVTTQNAEGAVVFQDAAASGSVMAFSMASGILNLFTPTSGVVMGAVAISRVGYDRFLKGIWPIVAGAIVLSIVMLAIGGAIGGQIA